jgi:hypothetical protein
VTSPCDADHASLASGRNRLEKRRRGCPHLPVEHTLSRLVSNPAGPRPGVQGNATVNRVLLGGAAPAVSSSAEGGVPNARRPRRYAEEGASIRINTLQRTGVSGALPLFGSVTGLGRVCPRR